MTAQALPPTAAAVDRELARLDAEVDWLLALSPIQNDVLWKDFQASGFQRIGQLRYAPVHLDLHATREELLELPVEDIESPVLSALLSEKQRELDRQIELVRLRGTDGFLDASLDLFGGVEPRLLELARRILSTVDAGDTLPDDAGIDEVLAATEEEIAWYREHCEGFSIKLEIDDDLNSSMMVSHGTFYVDGNLRLPRQRIGPLIQHEIGTHILTRHNGHKQPLRQLEVGLAHYDPLQEGLGVLAEYLAGYLPGERLRTLAARVLAVDMAINGDEVPAIFGLLHDEHGFDEEEAFDTAVRALRGGGLTKDAVYLAGLRDLLEYLHNDGDFERLLVGKFALSQCRSLDKLAKEGWLQPPEVLPRYLSDPAAVQRLQACRHTPVEELFHKEPC